MRPRERIRRFSPIPSGGNLCFPIRAARIRSDLNPLLITIVELIEWSDSFSQQGGQGEEMELWRSEEMQLVQVRAPGGHLSSSTPPQQHALRPQLPGSRQPHFSTLQWR
jgi:hypothetical protein